MHGYCTLLIVVVLAATVYADSSEADEMSEIQRFFMTYPKKAGPQGPLRFGKRRGPSGPLRFGKRSAAVLPPAESPYYFLGLQ